MSDAGTMSGGGRSDRPPWLIPVIVVIVVIALAALAALLLIVSSSDDDPPQSTAPSTTTVSSSTTGVPSTTSAEPMEEGAVCPEYVENGEVPISLCDRGDVVAQIQGRLVERGASLEADGFFGPATESAVKEFQASANLEVDGIVGPDTYAALFPLADGPVAEPAASLAPGEVSIADASGSMRYEVVSTCSSSAGTTGLQLTPSMLLRGDDGTLRVLDIVRDEGSPLSAQLTMVSGQTGLLNTLAGTPNVWKPLQWVGTLDGSFGNDQIDRLTMPAVDGGYDPDTGLDLAVVSMSYNPAGEVDCDTASIGPWTNEPVNPYAHAILAECEFDGTSTYLLSEGAVLRATFDSEARLFDDIVLAYVHGTDDITAWVTPDPIDPAENTYDDGAGGGIPFFASAKVTLSTVFNGPPQPVEGAEERRVEFAVTEPLPSVACS